MPYQLGKYDLNDLLIRNESGEIIPPYSIVRVTNTELTSGERPKVVVEKPDGDGTIHIATGPFSIPAGASSDRVAHGRSFDTRRWVKYSGTAPEVGDEVGPVDDEWTVSGDGSGFLVWGVDETNEVVLLEKLSGSGGGTTATPTECGCGTCLGAGSITDCTAAGEAPLNFTVPVAAALQTHFGTSLTLTHVSGCTWESDSFDGLDLGDGSHDYTWKLVFSGTGIEEVEITLEDET